MRISVRGVSLIEMMVSILIGMIVVAAVVSVYSGTAGASKMAEAQARMDEDAKAALSLLTQQLRMAGNNPKQPNRTSAAPSNPIYDSTTFMVRGCDGKFTNITSAATPQSLTCTAGTTTLPDSIAITYEADRFNTIPTSTGMPTDCIGSALTTLTFAVTTSNGAATTTTNINTYVADNRFYVTTTATVTAPSLYCRGGGGGTPQPLVENIEDLQFTYGTSPAGTATGTVAGYLEANAVETNSTVATGDTVSLAGLSSSAHRWARVVSVRLCVLVRSERPVVADAESAQYIDCQGSRVTNPPDRRLRRAYQTTVILRNRLEQ